MSLDQHERPPEAITTSSSKKTSTSLLTPHQKAASLLNTAREQLSLAGTSLPSSGWNSVEEEELYWAMSSDDLVALTSIIERFPGMLFTSCSPAGVSPLYIAALNNSLNCLELIVTSYKDQIDLNQVNETAYDYSSNPPTSIPITEQSFQTTGGTACFAASLSGNLEILNDLVNRGANWHIPDVNNVTPYNIAEFKKHTEIVDYFNSLSTTHDVSDVSVTAADMWTCKTCSKKNDVVGDSCEEVCCVCGRGRGLR